MVLLSHLATGRKPTALPFAVERGRRVYCSLYGGRYGTIVAVHAHENRFDAIFDDGRRAPRIHIDILHGPQWNMVDQLDDEARVQEAEAIAVRAEQERIEAAARAADAFQAEVAALRANAEWKHLTKATDPDHQLGIRNVRLELKHRWKGVTFSVRNKRGYGVQVRWTDGPTERQVMDALDPFRDRSFNASEDLYDYFRTPWHDVFGSCDFNVGREASEALLEKALTRVIEDHPQLRSWERVPVAALTHSDAPEFRHFIYPAMYINSVRDAMFHVVRSIEG